MIYEKEKSVLSHVMLGNIHSETKGFSFLAMQFNLCQSKTAKTLLVPRKKKVYCYLS